MDISKFVNQSRLQDFNYLKNSKNRYPQNGLTLVECISDMFQKISKIENVYLYTIHLKTYSLVYRYQAYKAGYGISPQNLEESKTASREVMTKK